MYVCAPMLIALLQSKCFVLMLIVDSVLGRRDPLEIVSGSYIALSKLFPEHLLMAKINGRVYYCGDVKVKITLIQFQTLYLKTNQ